MSNASKCFMFMYFLLPHCVPATCRSRAHTSINAEFPSGKQPTTRVRRRISRFSRSMTLFVRTRVQCSDGKSQSAVRVGTAFVGTERLLTDYQQQI